MARVCLILPVDSPSLPPEWVLRCRKGLEDAGHMVEVLAVLEGDGPPPSDPEDGSWSWVMAVRSGLSSAVLRGMIQAEAEGEILVVLDITRNYLPEDLARVVEPLVEGRADLAVAKRVRDSEHSGIPAQAPTRVHSAAWRYWMSSGIGLISRPILGVSDPFSGLVALTPTLARQVIGSFHPVGDRFTVDLLLRTRCRRVDVPVHVEGLGIPVTPSLDDFRHLKRLSDDRFGILSRLAQFCAVGASGMIVDLSSYAVLQAVFSRTFLATGTTPLTGGPRDLAAAGVVAIALALTWNFSLNRRLTFNDARAGSIPRQYLTYALSNAMGIALSLSLRLYLPAHVGFFNRHRLAAAVVGLVTATGISFTMARWLVFSRPNSPENSDDADLAGRKDKADADNRSIEPSTIG